MFKSPFGITRVKLADLVFFQRRLKLKLADLFQTRIMLDHTFICICAIAAFVFIHRLFNVPFDDISLASDLESIRLAYDIDAVINAKALFTPAHVQSYYAETTDRDYALLDGLAGSGMHTRLQGMQQTAYVMHEIANTKAKKVLEIGSGKGHCSLWLANAIHDVHFTGVDLLQRHVQAANAAKGELRNVAFVHGDAANIGEEHYDLIFGVESLCHLDTQLKMQQFIRRAAVKLSAGGRLIVIDGFRSATFHNASADQQLAMQLAEYGFRIQQMHSKSDWIDACAASGLSLVENLDLTAQALPFWVFGWRASRVLLRFPRFVRWLTSVRPQTAANLLSVATTAHAMRDSGAAEYGVLVFTR